MPEIFYRTEESEENSIKFGNGPASFNDCNVNLGILYELKFSKVKINIGDYPFSVML